MSIEDLNRAALAFAFDKSRIPNAFILGFVLCYLLFACPARGDDRPVSIVALFCGWGDSSGGATGEIHYCGIGGEKTSRFDRWMIQYSAAIGEAKASAEGAPDVDFTSASLGMKRLFGEPGRYPRLFASVNYWRATAIVAVPQLGLDVVGVDHGPGVSFGAEWALLHGMPITTELKYEWSRTAPKPESGGLCLSWALVEGCVSRSKVQGRHVDATRITLRVPLGAR